MCSWLSNKMRKQSFKVGLNKCASDHTASVAHPYSEQGSQQTSIYLLFPQEVTDVHLQERTHTHKQPIHMHTPIPTHMNPLVYNQPHTFKGVDMSDTLEGDIFWIRLFGCRGSSHWPHTNVYVTSVHEHV